MGWEQTDLEEYKAKYARSVLYTGLLALILGAAAVLCIPVNKSEPTGTTTDMPKAGEKILSGVSSDEPVRLTKQGPVFVARRLLV